MANSLNSLEFPSGPYPGLRPFEAHENAIFFGRETQVAELIDVLLQRRLLLVHGGSGCGKSSVVRAGVLPTMATRYEVHDRRFEFAIMRPLEGPITRLARILTETIPPTDVKDPYDWWSDQIAFSPNLHTLIEQQLEAANIDCFCLVIDQFEEILPWQAEYGRADIQLLLEKLASIGNSAEEGQRFFVILTMRSDYLKDCAQFDSFNRIINRSQYFLSNLNERGIYHSIVEPARLFGGTVDEDCADRLRFSVAGKLEQLPPLQHALMRMAQGKYEGGQRGWSISSEDLERVGGLDRGISQHAEEIWSELTTGPDAIGEDALNWLFRSLIDLDAGNRARRRPTTIGRLCAITGLSIDEVERVVLTFAQDGNNLLVVSDKDADRANHMVDLSHEAIIRSWKRMHDGEDGVRIGWPSRELQDRLRWQYLALGASNYETDNGELLSVAATEDMGKFFDEVADYPLRVERYLVAPEGKRDIADEPEWVRVSNFMDESRDRAERAQKWSKRVMAWAGGAVVVALLVVMAALIARNIATNRAIYQAVTNDELNALGNIEGGDAGELSVSSVEGVSLIESEVSDQSAQYWLWIGTEAEPKVALTQDDCADNTINPIRIAKDQEVVVCTNIVLRTGFPKREGQLERAVGVATYGSPIKPLQKPRPVPAGNETQYWVPVEVEPVAFPQVRIQAARTGESVDDNLQSQLVNQLVTRGYRFDSKMQGEFPGVYAIVYYCGKEELNLATRLEGSVNNILSSLIGEEKVDSDHVEARNCSGSRTSTDNELSIELTSLPSEQQ